MTERITELKIKASVDTTELRNIKENLSKLRPEIAQLQSQLQDKTGKANLANYLLGSKQEIKERSNALIKDYSSQLKQQTKSQIEEIKKNADILRAEAIKRKDTQISALYNEGTLSNKDIKSYSKVFSGDLSSSLTGINDSTSKQINDLQKITKEKQLSLEEDLKLYNVNSRLLRLYEAQHRINTQIDVKNTQPFVQKWRAESKDKIRAANTEELANLKLQRQEQERINKLQQLRGAASNVGEMGKTGISTMLGGWFAATAVASMAVQKSFEYQQAKARVSNVSLPGETNTVMKELSALAQTSGVSSVAELASTYAKIREGMKAVGATSKETVDFVTILEHSLKASGTTADQASAAIYQLSQALGVGTLRGDEFNSVAEGAPEFTRALARALGVTSGKLREIANTGGLTNNVLMSVTSEMGNLEKAAKNVPLTPMQTFNKLISALGEATAESKTGEFLNSFNNSLQDIKISKYAVDMATFAISVASISSALKGLQWVALAVSPHLKLIAGVAAGIGAIAAATSIFNSKASLLKKQDTKTTAAETSYTKLKNDTTINLKDIAIARANYKNELYNLYAMETDKDKAAEITKRIDALNNSDIVPTTKLGKFLQVESAFKLKDVKSLGGLSVSKEYLDQVNSFKDAIPFLDGSIDKIGNTVTNLDLSKFSSMLDTFKNYKNVDEMAFAIITLNNSLSKLSATQASMANTSIQQMTLSLEKAISTELTNKVEYASVALKKYADIVTTLSKNNLSNSLLNLSLSQNKQSMKDYKEGKLSTNTDELYDRERLNLQAKSDKDALSLKLDSLEKEKEAKLRYINDNTKMQIEGNNKNLNDTKKFLKDYEKELIDLSNKKENITKIDTDLELEALRNNVDNQSFLNNLNNKSGVTLTTDKTSQDALYAIRVNAEKSIQVIERESNIERINALFEYKSNLEKSIDGILTKQRDYAKQVIDLERDIANKRVEFERQSRKEQNDIRKDQLALEYEKKKQQDPKGTYIKSGYDYSAIKDQQAALDKELSKMRLSTTDYDKQQAIAKAKEEAQALKDLKIESLPMTGLSDIEQTKERIDARQKYLSVLDEINRAEIALMQNQKNSVSEASVNNDLSLTVRLNEQANINKSLKGSGGIELATAKDRLDGLKLGLAPDSIDNLRKQIQDSLISNPFNIKLNIDKSVPNNSNNSNESLAPVIINVDGKKIIEAKATQSQISDTQRNAQYMGR